MTVELETSRVSYTGSGTTGPFTIPFYFLANADIRAIKQTIATGAETELVLTTDFTLTGAGDEEGGELTLISSLSSSFELVIFRDPALLQEADYTPNDRFPSETHEQVADRAMMISQRNRDLIERAVRLPDGDTSGATMILPAEADRANKYPVFDANGEIQVSEGTGTDTGLREDLATAGASTGAVLVGFAASGIATSADQAARTTQAKLSEVQFSVNDAAGATAKAKFKIAIARAAAAGLTLEIPAGNYDLSDWLSSDTVAITSDLHIVASQNAVITGPGKASANGDFISVTNANVSITGGTWDGWRDILTYPDGNTGTMSVEILHAKWFNHRSVVAAATAQTGTVGTLRRVRIHGNWFSACEGGGDNGVDVNIYELKVADVIVTDNFCFDGGSEAFRFTPDATSLASARYVFSGNIFYTYTNKVAGADNDGHFIRCEGAQAVIEGNVFVGLYVGVGFNTLDTEGIRPTCDRVVVADNVFIDAGIQEGVCALKGSSYAIVKGNYFEITSGYKTFNAAHTASSGSVGVLFGAVHTQIVEGNTFVGFDNCPIDTEGSGDPVIARISGNTFVDCNADKASTDAYINWRLGGTVHMTDNEAVTTDSGTPVIADASVTFASADTGVRLIARNNRWHSTDTHYLLGINGGTIEADIQGDCFTGGDHIIRQGSSGATFTSLIVKNCTLESTFLKPFDIDGCTLKFVDVNLSGKKQTTGATQGVNVLLPMADGDAWSVRQEIVGRKSDGTDLAKYIDAGLYTCAAGTAAIEGAADQDVVIESEATWVDADISPSANDIRCRTGGLAATTIDWHWNVHIRGYTP